MTRHFLNILFLIVISWQISFAQGEFIPPNADLSFPRSIIDTLDIPTVRADLGSDATNFTLYNLIWNRADDTVPTGNTTNTDRRTRSEIAREAAFVFLMQRKVENQNIVPLTSADSIDLLNKVIDLLENINTDIQVPAVYNFYHSWQFRSPELSHFLIAYDLLRGAGVPQSLLTNAEAKLKEFAGTLYIRNITLYPCPNVPFCMLEFYSYKPDNHGIMNSVALGLAAIVLGDFGDTDPNFQPSNWMDLGMWSLDNIFFKESGLFPRVSEPGIIAGYAEGPNYFWYGFRNAFPFIRAMWNFLPDGNYDYTFRRYDYPIYPWSSPQVITRSIPHPWYDTNYHNVYDWMIKIRMPDGRSPSIHDSSIFFGTSMMALSGQSKFNIPNPTRPPTSIFQRSQYLSTNVPESNYTDDLFQALPEAGSLVFRSAYDDPSATYMHLIGKNGIALTGAKGHHQADATSFQLYFNGKMMALDAGYPSSSYRINAAQASDHNLILVNGNGPSLPTNIGVSMNNEAFIENCFDTPSLDYGEIRGNYQGADIVRKTMFLHNSFFIITDFVTSSNINNYQFQLHGHGLINAAATSTEGAFVPDFSNKKVMYSRGDTHLLSYLTARGDASNYSYESDFLSVGTNTYREHSKTLVHKDNVSDTEFLTVLFPYENMQTPNIQPLTVADSNVSAVFIDDLNFKNFLFTQPNNNTITIPVGSAPSNFKANGNVNLFSLDQTENFKMLFLENGDTLISISDTLIAADKKLDIFYEKTSADIFEGYVSEASTIQFHSIYPLAVISGNISSTSYDQNTQKATVVFSGATNFKFQENQSFSTNFYPDLDGDGFGDMAASPAQVPIGTLPPIDHILDNGDCDDNDANAFPNNIETCDLIDNNCNGATDEGFDLDNDTVADCFDNCPNIANAEQDNTDGDSRGDACDCSPTIFTEDDLTINNNPITSNLYESINTISSAGIVADTSTVIFQAGTSIDFKVGFIANAGSDFTAKIENCVTPPSSLISIQENELELFFEKEKTKKNIEMTIFPNPFENSTTIFLQIDKPQQVQLEIYDSTGKLVFQILDQVKLEEGEHQFLFDKKNNNSGIFYSVLRTPDETIIEKIILVR